MHGCMRDCMGTPLGKPGLNLHPMTHCRHPEEDGGEAQIASLVQEQLLGDVAAAREACKGAVLRRGAQRAAHAMAQPGRWDAPDTGMAPGQQFCVSVRPGELAHKRVAYTNRHSCARVFSLASNHPRLRLRQPSLALQPGESGRIGMALDARSAAAGEVYDMAVTVRSGAGAGGAGSRGVSVGEEVETFGVRMHVSP